MFKDIVNQVSQGSNLGLILFKHINDLDTNISCMQSLHSIEEQETFSSRKVIIVIINWK